MRRSYSSNQFRSYACRILFPSSKFQQDTEAELADYCVSALSTRGWRESTYGRNDCNKENSGAASNTYNRTPQKVRTFISKLQRNS